MSNGKVCCALGVCCKSAAEQEDALVEEMTHGLGCDHDEARRHARWMLKEYDLAPAGTLRPLIRAVAEMARKG